MDYLIFVLIAGIFSDDIEFLFGKIFGAAECAEDTEIVALLSIGCIMFFGPFLLIAEKDGCG